MARDVLMERRVAQAGTLQARSTAVDTRRARTRVGRASTKSARWEGVYRPRIDG